MPNYPDFEKSCGYGDVTGILGANCRHSFHVFIEGVSERTYTDEELEAMKPENRPKIQFEGREYDDYQATQKQRQIERTIRKIKRRKTAFEAAGLSQDAAAEGARLRALNAKYEAFSKAANLPRQIERLRVEWPGDLTDIEEFAPFQDYDGEIRVIRKFSDRQYQVELENPRIAGTRVHFEENLAEKPGRALLTKDEAQSIIDNRRLVLYQTDRRTLKFLADNGYVVINMNKELVTAVPEKLRKKYMDFLEGK